MEKIPVTKSITFRILLCSVLFSCALILAMLINNRQVTDHLIANHNQAISEIAVDVVKEKFADNYKLMRILISQITDNQEIIDAFARRDRDRLATLTQPSMEEFRAVGIGQYQFHLPDNTSFYRVHLPGSFADDLSSFRQTVARANSTKQVAYGLEKGEAGIGFRYVEPVFLGDQHLGSVELGISLGQNTLENLKKTVGGEWYFYELEEDAVILMETTAGEKVDFQLDAQTIAKIKQKETVYLAQDQYLEQLVPLEDFSGQVIGFLQRVYDNSPAMAAASQRRLYNIFYGVLICVAGSLGISLTLRHLLKPLNYLMEETKKFAQGDFSQPVPVTGNDEVGRLAQMMEIARQTVQTTKEELQESNELFKIMAEFSTDWIFWRSPQGEIIYSSPASQTITGYSQADFINSPHLFNEIVVPEQRDLWIEHVHQADSLNNPAPLEFMIITKDGERKWISHLCRPIYNREGVFLGTRGSNRDITHRKKAAAALEKSQASLARAQQIAKLGNWEWDLQTGEIFWSDEVYRIFGVTDKNFQPSYKKFLEFVHPEDREAVEQAIEAAFRQQPYDLEHKVVGWDGGIRVVHEQGEVFFGQNGKPERMVGTIQDITKRKQTEEAIAYLAYYDQLTGLPNRQKFMEDLSAAVAEAKEGQKSFAVLFLDLDRFKVVNDTLGHDVGDLLLREVGWLLKKTLHWSESVYRLGGDEFTIIVEKADEAESIARLIVEGIAQPFLINNYQLYITTSVGICVFPTGGATEGELVRNADIAMYHAKREGKNQYKFYSEEMDRQALEQLAFENDLRRALELNQFKLYFQPQVDLCTNQIIGGEALLRWEHPEKGLVTPDKFIPLAEETGLILSIGTWVLREACRQNKAWQDRGLPPLRVAVNISIKQFQQLNFVEIVEQILKETGLEPRYLELEITETIAMYDTERVIATLAQLAQLGVFISIDDFGMGYSSLNYLKQFPINALKIDRSFVSKITQNHVDIAIVESIINLAHNLNKFVIAEGVETAEQLMMLRRQKCNAVQGYIVSKPMPSEQFEEFLQNGFSQLAT